MTSIPATRQPFPAEVEDLPPVSKAIKLAALIVLLFFGVIGGWAALAPLDSAAIAPGRVIVDTNRKVVQHFEGGIVREILVREGDFVSQGQTLIRLDETRADAAEGRLRDRADTLLAMRARLLAERDRHESVSYPDEIAQRIGKRNVAEAIAGQNGLFESRRAALDGKRSILRQRIGQLGNEIDGLKAQVAGEERQLALIAEEVAAIGELVEKGLAPKSRLLELQRRAAAIEGSQGEHRGAIAQTERRIGETKLQILDLDNAFAAEVAEGLNAVEAEFADIGERLRVAKDVMNRVEIVAPQSGVVVGLKVHTVGAVIAPGSEVLQIVPQNDALVIEARLDPNDIDVVIPGLRAEVRLTAFKRRETLPLEGVVSTVSADVLTDERSGAAYYLARIAIDAADNPSLAETRLYPGMPAEVAIVTGRSTPLTYLLSPLRDSFHLAFREQ